MKYTYNLDDLNFNVNGKCDINASFQLKGMSVSVEFSCEELSAVGQCALAMKQAATEACEKLLPIIKDSIVEIGQAGSNELMRHRQFDHQFNEAKKEMETFKSNIRLTEMKAQNECDLEIAKLRYQKRDE